MRPTLVYLLTIRGYPDRPSPFMHINRVSAAPLTAGNDSF